MGTTVHHAIVVTSWDLLLLSRAHDMAIKLKLNVSEVIEGNVNKHCSFLVGPDGSNEGWAESEEGDLQRDRFKAWLKTHRDRSDGSSALYWFEAKYSSDHLCAQVIDHEWLDRQNSVKNCNCGEDYHASPSMHAPGCPLHGGFGK